MANDPDNKRGATILKQEERQEGFGNILTDIEQLELEVTSRLERYQYAPDQKLLQALKHAKRACNILIRPSKKLDIDRLGLSQRYFKRASNQLIKALRRL